MEVPSLELRKLAVPRLGLAAFRRRIIFRGAFLFLVAATLALAVVLLNGEKQRSSRNYLDGFRKTQAEIVAKLRHPSGQLALLNAASRGVPLTPLRPLVLPYGALDFDDHNKARQAVEMAGCLIRYDDGSTACAAVGNNPYGGAFIYLIGSFASGPLISRARGALDLELVHRARVTLDMRGETTRWIAPFESLAESNATLVRGRLTGFLDSGSKLRANARPVRDFRGWIWQTPECLDGIERDVCHRQTSYSIRLPVEVFREALFEKSRPVWPPPDLDRIQVRIEFLPPDSNTPLFDSNAGKATPPFSLDDLSGTLLPGEKLSIRRAGPKGPEIASINGPENDGGLSSPWVSRLCCRCCGTA